MSDSIDLTADIIDLRDVADRIDELQERAADLDAFFERDEQVEMAQLLAFASEVVNTFVYRSTLDVVEEFRAIADNEPTAIADRYFVEYAQEFADDIGAIDRNVEWPMSCINWQQAVRELQQDYVPFEYNGRTYWMRSF